MVKNVDGAPALRVFIVENHPDSLECFASYLETRGHIVLTASSVHEALEKIPGAKCDVLLSDIGLPDGSGWDMMKKLALPPTTYAVAMSGYGMNADRMKSISVGFRDHLLKPVTPDMLDTIMENAAKELARNR